jgi:TRAP transporter 4TM/12TM fusion protein
VYRAIPLVVGLAWAAFQLWYAVQGGLMDDLVVLPAHVGFAVALALLVIAPSRRRREAAARIPAYDLALAGLALGAAGYLVSEHDRLVQRIVGVDPVTPADVAAGVVLVALVLEASRRTAGLALTVLGAAFIAYAFLGLYFPGPLRHRGLDLERFIDTQVLSTEGLFGVPIQVAARMVFYFVLVGAFLDRSGAASLFVSVAYSLTGRARGGSAKASAVSSALFGTVSGSAVANVLVDGLFTIPLMKKTGFSPRVAGAVEAVASTGGQLMPPVMGAAAFVLAQIVGIPYWDVVVAAFVPAALYYFSLYVMVDLHARKEGLRKLRPDEIADLRKGLTGRLHLFLPLAYLVYLLSAGYSLLTVGLWTMIAVFLVSLLRRETRMGPREVLDALYGAARSSLDVAIPSAVAGIVVGTLVHTGVALRFQDILLALTGGLLLPSLVVTMLVTLVLGMGMPTTAAYLLAAILVAPTIVGLGVPPLAVHLFIFYFGVISMVTPPVALASFAAAGISGASLWGTGWEAFKFALAGFLIPYAFAFNQGLLLQGPVGGVVWVVATTALGVAALAASLVGYAFGALRPLERAGLLAASLMLIVPETITDLVGLALAAALLALQWGRRRSAASVPAGAAG